MYFILVQCLDYKKYFINVFQNKNNCCFIFFIDVNFVLIDILIKNLVKDIEDLCGYMDGLKFNVIVNVLGGGIMD